MGVTYLLTCKAHNVVHTPLPPNKVILNGLECIDSVYIHLTNRIIGYISYKNGPNK